MKNIYFIFYIFIIVSIDGLIVAQPAEAEECTDCISAEG